jgi:hypothetical protein
VNLFDFYFKLKKDICLFECLSDNPRKQEGFSLFAGQYVIHQKIKRRVPLLQRDTNLCVYNAAFTHNGFDRPVGCRTVLQKIVVHVKT